ncbi:MAG: hypothetical protein JXB85_14270 [Anaerolineales bacterium]|nr:hypothetical protein [Anaerolineales bacterium]
MYLIIFVLNDPDDLDGVLTAWEDAGVSGITILPSTGLQRLRQKQALRDDVPLIPSLSDFYPHDADINNTLFTLVDSDELVEKIVHVTENVVGDLNEPGNGILTVLPTARVYGLAKCPDDQAG